MGAPITSDRIANVQIWRDRSFTPPRGGPEPEIKDPHLTKRAIKQRNE